MTPWTQVVTAALLPAGAMQLMTAFLPLTSSVATQFFTLASACTTAGLAEADASPAFTLPWLLQPARARISPAAAATVKPTLLFTNIPSVVTAGAYHTPGGVSRHSVGLSIP